MSDITSVSALPRHLIDRKCFALTTAIYERAKLVTGEGFNMNDTRIQGNLQQMLRLLGFDSDVIAWSKAVPENAKAMVELLGKLGINKTGEGKPPESPVMELPTRLIARQPTKAFSMSADTPARDIAPPTHAVVMNRDTAQAMLNSLQLTGGFEGCVSLVGEVVNVHSPVLLAQRLGLPNHIVDLAEAGTLHVGSRLLKIEQFIQPMLGGLMPEVGKEFVPTLSLQGLAQASARGIA